MRDIRTIASRLAPTAALGVVLVLLVVLLATKRGDDSGPRLEAGASPAGSVAEAPGAAPSMRPVAPTGIPPVPASPGGVAAPVPGGELGVAVPSDPQGLPSAPEAAPPPADGAPVAVDNGLGLRPKIDPPPGAGCRPDGAQSSIGGHSQIFPCMPLFTGHNGGATAPGVSGSKIVLTWYIPQSNPAVSAAVAAAGAGDTPEDTDRMNRTILRYFNTHMETYAREVVLINVYATGAAGNEAAERADAIKIATDIGSFVNFGSTRVMAEELAARGIISIFTFETARQFLEGVRGYAFGGLPVLEEHYEHIAEFWARRLAGRKARFAGDAVLQASDRKFGLLWIDGSNGRVDEGFKRARNYFVKELARHGIRLTEEVAYNFDITRAGEQSTNMIVKMKDAGVTTLTTVGDPLYPIFLTKEATRQVYFPEWFISGTALIDTTFFGRTYDQAQWSHAFGQTFFWVFWQNFENADGYREYHHVCLARCEPGGEGVNISSYWTNLGILFMGIHMAGPSLTAKTFAEALYSYPAHGGLTNMPLYDFTPDSPTLVKDRTEVFWDSQGRGKDEVGKDGVGTMMKAAGGRRYRLGEWPMTEPANDGATAVFTTDAPYKTGPGSIHEKDGHVHPADQLCLSCRH